MRLSFAILTAVLTATSALAQPTEYPTREVLSAFQDGCGAIEGQKQVSKRLSSNGWRKISKEEESGELADFLAFSRKSGAAAAVAEDAQVSDLEAFEKTIAGETVHIILDEISADGIRISGCQLYDFGETRSIPVETIKDKTGRSPISSLVRPELKRFEWQPGLQPEHDSFKLFHVPSDSPVKTQLHFSGLALMSDTVGVSE